MRIESIILNGFKTYANTTKVEDLDPSFNAITGYNGSGKSNILDGIIFVLGLSSLKMARVENLRELVYKGGNAGIQTAMVTLNFDNRIKEFSPLGYTDVDEIKISREIKDNKSKFFINGRVKTQTQVKFMLKQCGLDMDNSFRFFVQQGTISKIINFRPDEIFRLIEDTAGVCQYNKEEAVAKKQLESKGID